MRRKEFAVIGAGRFGHSLATTLSNLGHEVMVIDKKEDVINKIASEVTYAVCADSSNGDVLKEIGVANVDTAIIAISSDFEASIMSTITCKELGVPKVIAKAKNDTHAVILKRVGADTVVIPERDMGEKLAHNLSSKNVIEFFSLSSEYSIIEIKAPKQWSSYTIESLAVRANYDLNILGLVRGDGSVNINPGPKDKIHSDDKIIVMGSTEKIAELEALDNE